jgi:hypothetical protein
LIIPAFVGAWLTHQLKSSPHLGGQSGELRTGNDASTFGPVLGKALGIGTADVTYLPTYQWGYSQLSVVPWLVNGFRPRVGRRW